MAWKSAASSTSFAPMRSRISTASSKGSSMHASPYRRVAYWRPAASLWAPSSSINSPAGTASRPAMTCASASNPSSRPPKIYDQVSLNHDSRVLEGHAVAVGALGEGLDRLAHRHGRELELLLVALAEAEASGFPQVADGLGREAE